MQNTLTSAIIGHLVGDYLLQNDWMALNKKRNISICALHAMLWTLAVMTFAEWWSFTVFAILYCTHLIQDHTNVVTWWMSKVGQRRFMATDDFDMINFKVIPGLGPWSVIVVDNVWHIVVLWAVWRFVV